MPGKISIDGKPVSNEPMDTVTQELELTVDARSNWTSHTIAVERAGYERADRVVAYQDKDSTYAIRLEPQKKTLTVTTNPPGAQVFIDGEPVGISPAQIQARPFPLDIQTDEVIPQKLRVE